MWTRKYTPKRLKEVHGQEEAVENLKRFVNNYRKGAAILYGPVGCGKTCSVYALAEELDLEVMEVNSSDIRNKENMHNILSSSIKQMSLFGKGKVILVDEIDALSGTGDRGGVQALVNLLDESMFPIVLTANDIGQDKIRPLVKKCVKIGFQPLTYVPILKALEHICKKEGIRCKDNCLRDLARQCGGDMRAAINDLQVLTNGRKELKKEDFECLGHREFEEEMTNALRLVFKSRKPENVLGAFDNVNCDLNEALMWIDQNIIKEYDNKSLLRAYDAMSRADVFNGRIRRWQHWRFLVYINALLTVGVALAKDEKRPGHIGYKRSSRILKMWMAKMKNMRKRAVAEKSAERLHMSGKRAFKDFLPYLSSILRGGNGMEVAEELELTEEEFEKLA